MDVLCKCVHNSWLTFQCYEVTPADNLQKTECTKRAEAKSAKATVEPVLQCTKDCKWNGEYDQYNYFAASIAKQIKNPSTPVQRSLAMLRLQQTMHDLVATQAD